MTLKQAIIQMREFLTKVLAAAFLAPLIAFVPFSSYAADWQWQVAPYLWASDVGLDVSLNSDPILGVNVPFNDLLDKLDMAFMGHVEGRGEKFGLMADAIYIDLGDHAVVTLGPGGPISGDLPIDTNMKLSLYEVGGVYPMGGDPDGTQFDIFLGARLIDVDQTMNITLPGPAGTVITRNIDVSEADVFFGGRVIGKLNDKWGYRVRADIGGGGTDGTLNALAAIGYAFGETGLFSIDVGYRYMRVEMSSEDSGTLSETEVTLSGPFVGFIFNF